MRAITIIVGFIISMLIATGFGNMILDMSSTYDTNLESTEIELLTNVSDWYNFSVGASQQLQEGTEVEEEGVSALSFLEKVGVAFQVLWDAIKFMPRSLSAVAGIYNIPDWLMFGGLSIVLLVFLIAIGVLIGSIIRGTG